MRVEVAYQCCLVPRSLVLSFATEYVMIHVTMVTCSDYIILPVLVLSMLVYSEHLSYTRWL